MDKKTLGQIGFEAYGNADGPHGAWKTFDGRSIPRWESLKKGENDDGTPNTGGPLTLHRWEIAADAIVMEHIRRSEIEEREDPPCLRVKMWPGGHYEYSMSPEAKPHMINAVDNLLRDCAAHNTPEEAARFNALRLELFRIFPEQKEGYISDPVEAIRASLRPPQPSSEHEWDDFAKRWYLPGAKGKAIGPNPVGA